MTRKLVGLALGSGAARGWAHIGIIRALREFDIKPDIIAGCSIGTIIGGAYCAGHLDSLEEWCRSLTLKDIVGFFDVTLSGGGIIGGDKIFTFLSQRFGDIHIETLPIQFAAVATELTSGQEIWIKKGPLIQAVRASISIPGIFTPVLLNDSWLIDGGLANPVPVSLCRALGADIVIAVNLNSGIIEKRFTEYNSPEEEAGILEPPISPQLNIGTRLKTGIKSRVNIIRSKTNHQGNKTPSLFEVIAASCAISQFRITQSRLAEHPPDLIIEPKLHQIGLLDFHRAAMSIDIGYRTVTYKGKSIRQLLEK